MFVESVDGVEEFAHDGGEGLSFSFAAGEEALVEGVEVGIAVGGDEGGHVEGAADMSVADLTDARAFVDRGARGMGAGIEAGMGDPLADGHGGGQRGEFSEEGDGTGGGDAGDGAELAEAGV